MCYRSEVYYNKWNFQRWHLAGTQMPVLNDVFHLTFRILERAQIQFDQQDCSKSETISFVAKGSTHWRQLQNITNCAKGFGFRRRVPKFSRNGRVSTGTLGLIRGTVSRVRL